MSEPTTTISELQFPLGIPGFPELRRFALFDVVEEGAFQELRSLDDSKVAMIVCNPWLFFPDYSPEVSEQDREDLSLENPQDAVVFCSVTLDEARDTVFVNLFAPFIVNTSTLTGRQVLLTDSTYPLRAPLELKSS